METQGITEGTLRTSQRDMRAVRRKRANTSLYDLTKRFIESCLTTTQIIRRRYDAERHQSVVAKQLFYVLENESRAESGFLIFQPKQPAVYVEIRKKGVSVSVLRMRVHDAVRENGGSILVATLDDIAHTLRLEDVWYWRGEDLFGTKTFTQRRETLADFVRSYWVPDARLLGGIRTTVANPISIQEWLERKEMAHSIDFIPDAPGRGRLWLAATVAAPAPTPAPAPPKVVAQPLIAPLPQPAQNPRMRVRAVALESLPDVYDIFDEAGKALGRASVQSYEMSKALAKKKECMVMVDWNESFHGYIITKAL